MTITSFLTHRRTFKKTRLIKKYQVGIIQISLICCRASVRMCDGVCVRVCVRVGQFLKATKISDQLQKRVPNLNPTPLGRPNLTLEAQAEERLTRNKPTTAKVNCDCEFYIFLNYYISLNHRRTFKKTRLIKIYQVSIIQISSTICCRASVRMCDSVCVCVNFLKPPKYQINCRNEYLI